MQILRTNGLKSVMTELVPALERESGSRPAPRWGSTVALLDALAGGAGGDIVILSHEAIDYLIDQGKAVAGSRVDLARSGIGIAVRKGAGKPDISSPDALKRALVAPSQVLHREPVESAEVLDGQVLDSHGKETLLFSVPAAS